MKKAIVHIGNVKTGTSALQAVLRVMRPDLERSGIIMPGLKPNEPAHYAISIEMGQPAEKALRRAQIWADITHAADDKTFLITAETLMYVPALWLKEKLEACGVGSFKIILYVRPHISLVGSFYLQNMKNGIIRGPVSEHLGMLKGAAIQFMRVAEDYANVFGHDNVIVREFHRSVLHDGSILGDFWDMAGLPASLRERAEATEQINNPTPSAEVALLVRACSNWMFSSATPQEVAENEAAPNGQGYFRLATGALFRSLAAHAKDLPDTRYRLPVYLQEALNARFQTERERFAATFFREKPTMFWVDEEVRPQDPLKDLPAPVVKIALKQAIQKMRNTEVRGGPQALIAFREQLPQIGTAPDRKIPIASLAETFGLADDVPPKDAVLQRLLNPK